MFRLAEIVVTVVWCLAWVSALALVAYLSDPKKRPRRLIITSLVFAPLPIWWWGNPLYYSFVARRDRSVFEDLCKKYAGDKILRRVDGVDAVFQMRSRDPSGEITHRRNQYAMEDPFGAIGDVGSGIGPYRYLDGQIDSGSYEVFEQPKAVGSKGPPYIRYVARKQKARDSNKPQRDEVAQLMSSYGYVWEDISTPDMRSRWIAGGKIKILDLRSNEVLAERTGFVFARYSNGSLPMYPWTNASRTCPAKHSTSQFVKNVLIPKR